MKRIFYRRRITIKQYDEELYIEYKLFALNSEKIAAGTQSAIRIGQYTEETLPSMRAISETLKENGFDGCEIEEIRTTVKRYQIN